ncbi:MAG: DedA family protein [Bacteriovoracaceae bacterium]
MEEIYNLIQSNVHMAPFIIFGMLLLAGFNIPVSEDGMLFISALLASKNPDQLVPLFVGVYLGAYFSDIICYSLGRFLGPKLFEIKMFKNMVPQERIDRIHSFYEKYGIVTLIFGRFIPFGVRNGLFLTAGLGKMDFLKFALSDLLAATISCSIYFTLYYKYGSTVVEFIKDANIIIFGVAIAVVLILWLRKKKLNGVRS